MNPKYLTDAKGRKKAVLLDMREYEGVLEVIEDLEDANDLLRAERAAKQFTPYEEFRKTWLAR